jgi:hypothetical protein
MVAGIVAVHMNYQPWDKAKTGVERVKEGKRSNDGYGHRNPAGSVSKTSFLTSPT